MPKLLFVEDDPFISEIYTKKFAASGFDVVSALTGKEALKKALEGPYDVMMLDMVIPEISGMEVLHELRTNKEYDPTLKILIFSNLSGPEERQAALSAGASGFISKTDFTPSEVVAEVQRYLSQFASQAKHADAPAESSATSGQVDPVSDTLPDPGTERKILLIEDEPVFAEMFGKALRDAGYAVVAERHGQRGLDRALSGSFDLVITNQVLPGVSGLTIIETLRADDRTKSLPVFLLTASHDEEEVKSYETAGKVTRAFLKTKVTPSEFASVVKDFFSGR